MSGYTRSYSYSYRVMSTLVPEVKHHFFKLRALPMDAAFQHVVESRLVISPTCVVNDAVDGFGNRVQYGGFAAPHDTFCMESNGTIECSLYAIDGVADEIYRYPTRLTQWDESIRMLGRSGTPADIMHAVHRLMTYERFVTTNATTAREVCHTARGVCQDYAHLMISACLSAGMVARYVNGITLGEGETHAWVEVHDGRQWRGYDPTMDRVIDYGYIKFAHGRDVNDCPSNRGRFYGWTAETKSVCAKMNEITIQ